MAPTNRLELTPQQTEQLAALEALLQPHIVQAPGNTEPNKYIYDIPIKRILTEDQISELGRLRSIKLFGIDTAIT